jgi:hypothetical protein
MEGHNMAGSSTRGVNQGMRWGLTDYGDAAIAHTSRSRTRHRGALTGCRIVITLATLG